MKIIDMSHVMNVHTPGWVGYAGNRMYYAQNLQTQMIVAQRIETALHVGTHFDGAMHATDNLKGDMASLPLDYLVNRGVVVDISAKMSDWAVITPEVIESAGADIRDGDILLLHTGWHRHYEGRPQQDLVKYFCFHPGPNLDTLRWMLNKKIKWWGMDTGSCDHAMNTSIRTMRADLAAQFTKRYGKTPGEFFGTFEYTHKKSGRRVAADVFPFHSWAFQEGLLHAENLGGDIELMLNKRALIGAFPWRYQGLEACPCRIVAFLDAGDNVEAVGNAAKALMASSARRCRHHLAQLACRKARGAPIAGAFGKSAMAKISAPDGVQLYVEAVGSGTPVVFVHEYAGDYRSWEPQVRYFC